MFHLSHAPILLRPQCRSSPFAVTSLLLSLVRFIFFYWCHMFVTGCTLCIKGCPPRSCRTWSVGGSLGSYVMLSKPLSISLIEIGYFINSLQVNLGVSFWDQQKWWLCWEIKVSCKCIFNKIEWSCIHLVDCRQTHESGQYSFGEES